MKKHVSVASSKGNVELYPSIYKSNNDVIDCKFTLLYEWLGISLRVGGTEQTVVWSQL